MDKKIFITDDHFKILDNGSKGTTNEIFYEWFSKIYIPNSKQNDILLMDNLSSHHHQKIIEESSLNKRFIIFIPSRTPQLNPCDNSIFSSLKEKWKEFNSNNKIYSEQEKENFIKTSYLNLFKNEIIAHFESCFL